MEFIKEYIRFDGRLNRKPYWLRVLALLAIMFGGLVAGSFLFGASAPIFGSLLIFLSIAFVVVASLGISIRRLHDRNKSGWWLFPLQIVPNGLLNMAETTEDPNTALILSLIGFALALWGFVEIGILKGTDGPNQYGEDPLNRNKQA